MRLLVAEKPSMAREIAKALGVRGAGNGRIEDPGKGLLITWAVGHLVELVDPETYDKAWGEWSWATLPMLPPVFQTRPVKTAMDQWKIVKDLLQRKDLTDVVCATDAGREGQLIFDYIYQLSGCRKPILRLWTSSLTEAAIREAYGGLKPWSAYQGLTDSARCRSEADWLVGLNGTRALTLHARSNGRTEKGAWNVGRVTTPTLSMLVEREIEIRDFVPKAYFTVDAVFGHPHCDYPGKWFKGETTSFPSQQEANALLVKLHGHQARIAKADTKEERRPPEQFYDLTALQCEANNRFKFSAEKTLELAQALYERKLLSYPRTASRHLTQQDAQKIPAWLQGLGRLAAYAPHVRQIKDTPLGKRHVDDTKVDDHSALVPTEELVTLTDPEATVSALPEDQRKVFDLVMRRFLAAFFPHQVLAKSTIITEIAGETFRSHGKVVLDPGWTAVDTLATKRKKAKPGEDEEDENLTLPAVTSIPEQVATRKLQATGRETKPPRRFTEADLLTAMKSAGKDLDDEELRGAMRDCGLGTPATRAATIEKLLDAGTAKFPKTPLVKREKNVLVPTEKGMLLVQTLPDPLLRSPELTGNWEAALEKMRRGEETRDAFMHGAREYTKTLIEAFGVRSAVSQPRAIGNDSVPEKECPKCKKGKLLTKPSQFGGYWVSCTKACGLHFSSDASGFPIGGICKHCGGPVKVSREGKPTVCGVCDNWQTGPSTPAPRKEATERPNGNQPPPPPKASCPKCRASLKSVYAKQKWLYRCDACEKWFGVPNG